MSAAAQVLADAGAQVEAVDPGLRAAIERHGTGVDAADYLAATAVRMELGVRMGAFHDRYDLLVCPTVPIAAFPAGQDVPDGWPAPLWTSWSPYTYPFNLTQQPALSVPCGLTADGRPVGLQLVGARHRDRLVLRAGHAYQLLTDWHRRTPTLLAAPGDLTPSHPATRHTVTEDR